MSKPNIKNGSETKSGGIINRLGQAAKSRVGRVALGVVLASGAAFGTAQGVEAAQASHKLEFEATQNQIKPVIEAAMIDIDNQTLAELQAHPENITKIDAPDGHKDAVGFINKDRNVRVIMGLTNGMPDPNEPIYVNYYNNQGTGKGSRGIHVVMTAPEGKWVVDQHRALRDFGGDTEGGWAASIGGEADTTDRGYAAGGPAPFEAAQQIAATAAEFAPYEPYQ